MSDEQLLGLSCLCIRFSPAGAFALQARAVRSLFEARAREFSLSPNGEEGSKCASVQDQLARLSFLCLGNSAEFSVRHCMGNGIMAEDDQSLLVLAWLLLDARTRNHHPAIIIRVCECPRVREIYRTATHTNTVFLDEPSFALFLVDMSELSSTHTLTTSIQEGLPAELKHISKRRKRNQQGYP